MAKLDLIRPDEALLAQGSNAVMATAGYYARAIEDLLGKLAAERRDLQSLQVENEQAKVWVEMGKRLWEDLDSLSREEVTPHVMMENVKNLASEYRRTVPTDATSNRTRWGGGKPVEPIE
jgi:hypothetical protein